MTSFNRFIAILLIGTSLPLRAMADCNWATDIKKNPDGSRTYTEECHIVVGKNIKELELRREQVEALNQTIQLKDLAILKLEQRNEIWMNTSIKMNDSLNSYERLRSTNYALYFGLGVVATSLAVWGAGQLANK